VPSICLLTGSHFCRNPRVVKEANALAAAGYEVTVLAPVLAGDLRAEDERLLAGAGWRHEPYCDLRPARAGRAGPLLTRLVRRLGAESVRWLGWQAPASLGYGASRLLRAALRTRHDLYIGHQEVGSWAACELAARGRQVGADVEDWYSRDLLPAAQARRPVRLLRRCERFLLKHGAHVTTTSVAMADALAKAYEAPPPRVVYNAFPWSDRAGLAPAPAQDNGRLSLHWVSQTIGPGRGLEELGQALQRVEVPVRVSLRGAADAAAAAWVRGLFPPGRHTLELLPLVPPADLLGQIARHDVGLALESQSQASRNYTVTNKILHYLLGGLAVVATDTRGQAEVAAAAGGAVRLCRADDPSDLAAQLNALAADPEGLREARVAALDSAFRQFCWERQVPVLLESVAEALRGPRVLG
jgi:hypothetical protein